jgi:hypothetical protein
VVRRNVAAARDAVAHLSEVAVPATATATRWAGRSPRGTSSARHRDAADRGDLRGQRLPARRHLAGRHGALGRNIADDRSGTRSSSATSAFVCPRGIPSARSSRRRSRAPRPATRRSPRSRAARHGYVIRSRPRTAPAASSAPWSARRATRPSRAAKR